MKRKFNETFTIQSHTRPDYSRLSKKNHRNTKFRGSQMLSSCFEKGAIKSAKGKCFPPACLPFVTEHLQFTRSKLICILLVIGLSCQSRCKFSHPLDKKTDSQNSVCLKSRFPQNAAALDMKPYFNWILCPKFANQETKAGTLNLTMHCSVVSLDFQFISSLSACATD